MGKSRESQIDLAARLQTLLLENFEELFKSGAMTAADRSTLSRLLMANGWSLDPASIPQGLRDKLTKHIDPRVFDDNDPDLPVN